MSANLSQRSLHAGPESVNGATVFEPVAKLTEHNAISPHVRPCVTLPVFDKAGTRGIDKVRHD
jgi:hypothetical protein